MSSDGMIAAKRLDAVPWALRFVSCQARREHKQSARDNSLTRRDLCISRSAFGGASVL